MLLALSSLNSPLQYSIKYTHIIIIVYNTHILYRGLNLFVYKFKAFRTVKHEQCVFHTISQVHTRFWKPSFKVRYFYFSQNIYSLNFLGRVRFLETTR